MFAFQHITASRRRSSLGSAAAAAIALSLAACGGSDGASDAASPGGGDTSGCEEIVIGSNESLTGGAASVGVPFGKGFETAVASINAEGGVEVAGACYTFKGDVQDNKTDPAVAIGINKKFAAEEVRFVFGPQPGVLFAPAFQSLLNTDTMVFTAAASADQFQGTPQGKHLFNPLLDTHGEKGEDTQIAQFAVREYSPKTVALLIVQDASGDAHRKTMQEEFEKAGVEIVYDKQFVSETRDFSSFVAEIKATKPDMVVAGYLDNYAKPIFADAAAAGLTEPVFVGTRGVTADAVDANIDRYVLSVPTVPVADDTDPRLEAFREAFKTTTGEFPTAADAYAASFWDALHMLAKAMETTGTTDDLDKLAEALRTDAVTDYPDRMMDLTFDETGQGDYPIQVQVIDGGNTTYPPASE